MRRIASTDSRSADVDMALERRREQVINALSPSLDSRALARVSNDLANLASRRSRVSFDDINNVLSQVDIESRQSAIEALEASGFLVGVKSSGKVTHLGVSGSARYTLSIPVLTPEERERVRLGIASLDVRLKRAAPHYLETHPLAYLKHERELSILSEYLVCPNHEIATRKERAYELFGDEKALEPGSSLAKLLRSGLRLDLNNLLGVITTSSPDFMDYVIADDGLVVLSENKDPYFDFVGVLRRYGPVWLFGRFVGGVIFGSGWKAVGDGFSEYLDLAGISAERLLYVGDIDVDGVAILQALQGRYEIEPYTGLYAAMARAHADRRKANLPLNLYDEVQCRDFDLSAFAGQFDAPDLIDEVTWAIEHHIRIPQEIVSLGCLEDLAKEGGNG